MTDPIPGQTTIYDALNNHHERTPMPRLPRDPNETPEAAAARILQNAGGTFTSHATRFTTLCSRYSEDLTPEDRDTLEAWARSWADRLVYAIAGDHADARLHLHAGAPTDDGTTPSEASL